MIDEYKVSNELLTEDIYVSCVRPAQNRGGTDGQQQALQAAVQRIEGYVKTLEEEVQTKKK